MCQPNDGLRRVGDVCDDEEAAGTIHRASLRSRKTATTRRSSSWRLCAEAACRSKRARAAPPQARRRFFRKLERSRAARPQARRRFRRRLGRFRSWPDAVWTRRCRPSELLAALTPLQMPWAKALLGGTPEPAASIAPKAASLSETGKRPTAVSMA
eukprot:s10761_g1.t1